jgi:tRNA pseudouridine55 synthase
VVVDKPAGMTSHDVVARVRRIVGTRKVGHAGTLDPMATGVLLLGVERATRLLGHLALTDKAYSATIRLGATTITDDREGDVLETTDASGVTDEAIEAALAPLRGAISQRPSSVSAVKVDGVRAYTRVRSGEDVELPSRDVTVSRLEVVAVRRTTADLTLPSPGDVHLASVAALVPVTDGPLEPVGSPSPSDVRVRVSVVDVDVEVVCSSGTYVRALARDLGAALGVGGHLTTLRRTRVGPFDLASAVTLEQLEESATVVPLGDAVATTFPRVDVDEATADLVLHGVRIAAPEAEATSEVGVFGPDGTVLALAERRDAQLHYLIVFS